MSKEPRVIDLEHLSPKAIEALHKLSKTSGFDNMERTVEELAFSMTELIQLIDTRKDPLLEPEAATRQMEIMRGILQRFKRYEE
jgi:hypothetical protein